MFKPGKAVHPSNGIGTAPDAAVTEGGTEISFDRGSNRNRQSTIEVIVSNLEAIGGNNLEISFVSGREWFAIPPATTVRFPIMIHEIRVRGATGATTAYAVMAVVA
jgi:hypothetical protein